MMHDINTYDSVTKYCKVELSQDRSLLL